MKFFTYLFIFITMALFLGACGVSPCFAQLDFERDVIHIPGTHEAEKYAWQVRRNPDGYKFSINKQDDGQDEAGRFRLTLKSPPGEMVRDIHLLITDKSLKGFQYVHPEKSGEEEYGFEFHPYRDSKYRFELAIETNDGWVNLKKDIYLRSISSSADKMAASGDNISVRVSPAQHLIYSEHVITFIYKFMRDGKPVDGLEKIQGTDIHAAAWRRTWFTGPGEFIYAASRQSPGGPEVAVSMVFPAPGRYFVFGQFKYAGKERTVDFTVDVLKEPGYGNMGDIISLEPDDG